LQQLNQIQSKEGYAYIYSAYRELLRSGPHGNRASPPHHIGGFKKPMSAVGFGNAGLTYLPIV
jgi:hypothetical protein